jgi:hypothetical protein
MTTDTRTVRALGDVLADHPDHPDTLLPWVAAHELICRLLAERDEGWQPEHVDEAAGLHWRLRLMYGELGGYPFDDAAGVRYYHGYDLCQAARRLGQHCSAYPTA